MSDNDDFKEVPRQLRGIDLAHKQTRTLGRLLEAGYAGEMKPWHSQAYKVHTAVPACQYQVSGSFSDLAGGGDKKEDFYHMEVSQLNGHWAFVTPVWVEK